MMKRRFRKKNYNYNSDKRTTNPLKHSYESGGSGSRMRGNASQLSEKYMTLGREAKGNGDSIMMEHYFQYAEHYQRKINQYQETMEARNQNWYDDEEAASQGDNRNAPRSNVEHNDQDLPLPGPINASAKSKTSRARHDDEQDEHDEQDEDRV